MFIHSYFSFMLFSHLQCNIGHNIPITATGRMLAATWECAKDPGYPFFIEDDLGPHKTPNKKSLTMQIPKNALLVSTYLNS